MLVKPHENIPIKRYFSEEQIISILLEAEAGISARARCRKHVISDASCMPRVRSIEVWMCPRLSARSRFPEKMPLSKGCLPQPCWIKEAFQVGLRRNY